MKIKQSTSITQYRIVLVIQHILLEHVLRDSGDNKKYRMSIDIPFLLLYTSNILDDEYKFNFMAFYFALIYGK